MGWSIRRAAGALIVAFVALGARGDAQQAVQPQPPAQSPAAPDAPAPEGQQPPVFRTGINFVRVDVMVSGRDGQLIDDLKADDFEVLEDGQPQSISTFRLVKLDGGAVPGRDGGGAATPIRSDDDEAREAARDDVRLFAIFLDDYHLRRETSLRIRAPLEEFVSAKLGPTDLVGLMYPLQSLDTVRFTRNRDAVAAGIEGFVGRKYEYQPTNAFEERYAWYPTESVERIRVGVSLSALEGLIIHLGGLKEGRKSLLLVSEGYTYMVPPQMRSDSAQTPVNPLSPGADPLAGENDLNEDRASFLASADMQQRLRLIWDTANKNNVSIYAIDPRGLTGSEFDIADNIGGQLGREYLRTTQDTLRTLSDQSDGRALVNRNDMAAGLSQIVRDSSAYYLLGYDSVAAPTDGKFHKIDVRVKRSNVQVRARQGYWAITPENAERVLAPEKPGPPPGVSKALSVVDEPVRARVIQSWLGTSRGDGGKTTVTFVWQPAPRPGARAADAPAAVTLMALGDDGTPYYRGRVAVAPGATPAAAPGPARASFDVPPGLVHLRITVEDENQETLDSEVRDLEVPDLTSPELVLGTPLLYRAGTARQIEDIKAQADPVPAVGRTFNRAERLLVRVPVYGVAPTVVVRLLNQAGEPMRDLDVEQPGPDGVSSQFELPLNGLAPGDYVLEIGAGEPPARAVEYVGIRVGA
jgi:VWFA-related protein